MQDNEYLAKTICSRLESRSPAVLISIVSLQGSTPRHIGTKMVVDAAGKTFGTIGGSLLEATAIAESKHVLERKQSRFLRFELTGKNAYSSGMICGGVAVLLMDYITPTPENLEFFHRWYEAVKGSQDYYYVTRLKENAGAVDITGRCLVYPDGQVSGECPLEGFELEEIRSELHNMSSTTVMDIKDSRIIVDPMRRVKTAFIFGAGHVGQPTARIASMVGFRVAVIDDRAEFANAERFPEADEIRVIEDFNRAFEGLDVDEDSFIVILTRGHQYDREVLEQALKTPAGYIGMISSRKKREAIYAALTASGVAKEALDKVHSPIGLPIGAETPEEIAVCIVAEMISERNRPEK